MREGSERETQRRWVTHLRQEERRNGESSQVAEGVEGVEKGRSEREGHFLSSYVFLYLPICALINK